MEFSPRPNHKIAKGTQHILGSVCIPMSIGFKYVLRYFTFNITAPTMHPIIQDIIYPITPLPKLYPIDSAIVPSFQSSKNLSIIPTILGKV